MLLSSGFTERVSAQPQDRAAVFSSVPPCRLINTISGFQRMSLSYSKDRWRCEGWTHFRSNSTSKATIFLESEDEKRDKALLNAAVTSMSKTLGSRWVKRGDFDMSQSCHTYQRRITSQKFFDEIMSDGLGCSFSFDQKNPRGFPDKNGSYYSLLVSYVFTGGNTKSDIAKEKFIDGLVTRLHLFVQTSQSFCEGACR